MTDIVSLVEANRLRAQYIAQVLAERLPEPGSWQGYNAGEKLRGVLETPDTLRYWRDNYVDAPLHMGFMEMVDIKEESRSEPTIIERDVLEHHERTLRFDNPTPNTPNTCLLYTSPSPRDS